MKPFVQSGEYNKPFLGLQIFVDESSISAEIHCCRRGKRDYNKAISYTNAVTTSCVPNALVKWATHQIRLDEHNRPSANTPQGLLS